MVRKKTGNTCSFILLILVHELI